MNLPYICSINPELKIEKMKKDFSCFACVSSRQMMAKYPANDHGILILESSPETAYYSRAGFPENLKTVKDHHLYLVVKKPSPCFQDRVMRRSHRLKEELGISFHVAPGMITYRNRIYSTIRIRTSETELIPRFIEEFRKIGIRFLATRNVAPYEAFVQIKRYTDFVLMEPGIFRDADNPKRYFVTIPKDIDFEVFEDLIREVKNNCNFHMFDASLIYLNCGSRFLDMVSVYSDHCEEERLSELKNLLEENIVNMGL